MLFTKSRKRKSEAQEFLARITNQWMNERVEGYEERRAEERAILNVGVWIIPMDQAGPVTAQAFVALTKDLSRNGLSVITHRSITTSTFLVCFSGEPEVKFLLAKVHYRKHLGLGWIQLCMEVTGIVDKDDYPQLSTFTGLVMF